MMSTRTRAWRRLAAAATVTALSLPAGGGPAPAAPSDPPDLADARRLRAMLAEVVSGAPRVSATGVDDGYPGGIWVAAGDGFSCSAGSLSTYCWGANGTGQLGDGSTGDATDPVEVDTSGDFADVYVGALSAGRVHACALSWFDETEDGGDLYCWGDNTEGQIGADAITPQREPVLVAENVRQVAAGSDHTCVITDDAAVECWGRNNQGQLGTGAAGPSESEPQAVAGLSDVIDLSAGGDTTCAIVEDGTAFCWGADDVGQVGDGSGASLTPAAPVAVVMSDVGDEFVQIELGPRHACAVTAEGPAWCWGDDTAGQLGNGAPAADTSQPVEVDVDGDAFESVSAGTDSTCGVVTTGAAYCWGANAEGQLGTGDRTGSDVPVAVDLSGVPSPPLADLAGPAATAGGGMLLEVSVGDAHVCGLDVQGNAYCWGDNSRGQIGDGTTDDALAPVGTSLVPGPATDVRVMPGDRELRVTWSQPAELGTSDLLGYFPIALRDDDFGDGYCRTTVPNCAITDLTNGVDYTVVVITQTRGGLSISDAVPGMPLGPSPAPVPGVGGGQLPITGAAVSLVIAVGGGLLIAGMLCLRLVRRRP